MGQNKHRERWQPLFASWSRLFATGGVWRLFRRRFWLYHAGFSGLYAAAGDAPHERFQEFTDDWHIFYHIDRPGQLRFINGTTDS